MSNREQSAVERIARALRVGRDGCDDRDREFSRGLAVEGLVALDELESLGAERDRAVKRADLLDDCLSEACDWNDPDGAAYAPVSDAVTEAEREMVAHWRAALVEDSGRD